MKKNIAFILCFFMVSIIFAQNKNKDEIIINQNGFITAEQVTASIDNSGNTFLCLVIFDKLGHHAYAIKAVYHNDTEKEIIQSKMIELIITYENNKFEDIEPKILLYSHKYKTLYHDIDHQAYEVKTYIWN